MHFSLCSVLLLFHPLVNPMSLPSILPDAIHVTVNAGEGVKLYCPADEPRSVSWERNGVDRNVVKLFVQGKAILAEPRYHLFSGSDLLISDASPDEDQGEFRCYTSDSYLDGTVSIYSLTVIGEHDEVDHSESPLSSQSGGSEREFLHIPVAQAILTRFVGTTVQSMSSPSPQTTTNSFHVHSTTTNTSRAFRQTYKLPVIISTALLISTSLVVLTVLGTIRIRRKSISSETKESVECTGYSYDGDGYMVPSFSPDKPAKCNAPERPLPEIMEDNDPNVVRQESIYHTIDDGYEVPVGFDRYANLTSDQFFAEDNQGRSKL